MAIENQINGLKKPLLDDEFFIELESMLVSSNFFL